MTSLRRSLISIFILMTSLSLAARERGIKAHEIPRGDFAPFVELPMKSDSSISRLLINLNENDRRIFMATGERIYRHDGDFHPVLIWDRRIRDRLEELHSVRKNDFALEVLMALELPAGAEANENVDLELLNILHRISTLKGLKYFSASRGKMREFYLSSTVIDNPDDKNPLPDPSYSSYDGSMSFYIRQEDASFKDNIYQVNSSTEGFSMINVTPMRYGPIKIAGRGDFELFIQVKRSGGTLLFYVATSVKAPKFLGIRTKVRNSFYNRIVALYNWFHREIGLTKF